MGTFTFEVPPDRVGFQPGKEIWVNVVCRTSAFSDSTPTEFLYASARATIGVGGSDALRLDRKGVGLNEIEPGFPDLGARANRSHGAPGLCRDSFPGSAATTAAAGC